MEIREYGRMLPSESGSHCRSSQLHTEVFYCVIYMEIFKPVTLRVLIQPPPSCRIIAGTFNTLWVCTADESPWGCLRSLLVKMQTRIPHQNKDRVTSDTLACVISPQTVSSCSSRHLPRFSGSQPARVVYTNTDGLLSLALFRPDIKICPGQSDHTWTALIAGVKAARTHSRTQEIWSLWSRFRGALGHSWLRSYRRVNAIRRTDCFIFTWFEWYTHLCCLYYKINLHRWINRLQTTMLFVFVCIRSCFNTSLYELTAQCAALSPV